MKQFFTIATLNFDTSAKTIETARKRVERLRKDTKLRAEIESYLNRKLKKFDITVSRFDVETTIDEI